MADEGLWSKLQQTWPARAAEGLWQGLMAPGNALASTTPITSEQMIEPAANMAGLVTLGAGAVPTSANELRTGMSSYWKHASAEPEKIVSAATKFDGKIYEGKTHAHAYQKYKDETNKTDAHAGAAYGGDGFVTNTGRFVDREEAQRIVDIASPNIDPANRRTTAQRQLYAEELK